MTEASEFKSGFVALLGRPNTGKSTLINALVGRKVAIVSPKPQTTRNRIAGIVNRPHAQVVFLDTPGLHKPTNALGKNLVAAAKSAMPDAEVACVVIDGSVPLTADDQRAVSLAKKSSAPPVLIINKLDLMRPEQIDQRRAEYAKLVDFRETIAVSAAVGTNLDALLAALIALLPAGPRYFPEDMVTDHAMEFRIAEFIREAALQLTHQEVPHAVAVQVETLEPRPGDLTFISANVIVEREAHKGIIIGAGGGMIKAIGQAARAQIEPLVGGRVYLELRVKVKEKWRDDDSMLVRLGLAD